MEINTIIESKWTGDILIETYYNEKYIQYQKLVGYDSTYSRLIHSDTIQYEIHNWLKRTYDKKWCIENPEKILANTIRRLTKCGKLLDMTIIEYRYALVSWSKIIKKIWGKNCNGCGSSNLVQSHHILHKAKHPHLTFDLTNGIPLCHKCHMEVHGWNSYQ